MAPLFAASARERLERLSGIGPVEIELDQRHDWEPDDMDPAYRARLEEARRRSVRSRQAPPASTGSEQA
jgi:metal-sulfur cluster biosynthetic enzyme